MAPPHRLEMTEKDRKEMIFFMRLASAAYLDLAEVNAYDASRYSIMVLCYLLVDVKIAFLRMA